MKIGMIDVDGHAKKKKWGATIYPNLALCKIAAYHKSIGNEVEWYNDLSGQYDIVYMSKVFNFSPDYPYIVNAKEIIKGGTGYDITSTLADEIDQMQPDFSIYPTVPEDTAYGFLTRGCPNKCVWCVVPKKEGHIRPYMDIDKVAQGRKKVVLMDNNILAAGDYAKEQLQKIIDKGYKVDFNQALDARLVTDEYAQLLAKVKWIQRIRFGCDTEAQIKECYNAMSMISSYGYKGEFFLYTIVGGKKRANESDFDWNKRLFVENYNRINYWKQQLTLYRQHRGGQNAYPYAQPYRDPINKNTPPQWQKDLALWTNKRMIFFTTEFKDFEPRKKFRCKEYLNQYGILN